MAAARGSQRGRAWSWTSYVRCSWLHDGVYPPPSAEVGEAECASFDSPEAVFEAFKNRGAVFTIFQVERAPSTGRIHMQGYSRFGGPVRLSTLRLCCEGHFEIARGGEASNITYCSKDESRVAGPWESGERSRQGKRKDIDDVRDMVKRGKTYHDVLECVQSNQALMFAKEYIRHLPLPLEKTPPVVYWLHGATGTGKSQWVIDRLKDLQPIRHSRDLCVSKSCNLDPYENEEFAWFDDFRADRMPFNLLLQITDRYPMKVRVLYGYVEWKPEVIVFTCQYSIRECFKRRCDEDLGQLYRRIRESGGAEILFGDAPVVRSEYGAQSANFR